MTAVIGLGNNLFRIDLDAQRQPHQDRELGARIESAHILSRIGLRIALGLRFGQHRRILRAFFHLAQDEVAGAIQNAFNALDAVAGEPLLQARNHRNSAGNSRAILQMAALGRGQPLQFHTVKGNQFLVRRDHALARFQCSAHPAAGRDQAPRPVRQ